MIFCDYRKKGIFKDSFLSMKFQAIILIFNLPFFMTQIYYVSPQITFGNICDGSLSYPYPNIQTSISLNNSLKMTLILIDGIYIGDNNVNINIDGMEINITSLNGPGLTIFDCQHNATLFYLKNTIFNLNNITIMNCYKWETGDPSANTSGGAIIINSGTLYFQNLIFFNNIASYGGALSCLNSKCYISSCVFYNNTAAMNGGAIYALNSYLEIDSNINITSNSAGQNGGGIYCENGSFLTYGSNTGFQNNSVLPYYSSDFSCKNESGTVDLAHYSGSTEFTMDCDQCLVNDTCTSGNCMKSCPCKNQYFNKITNACSQCPAPGQTCGKNNPGCNSNCKKTKCSCLAGYFCSGTGCLACNSTCSSCINQTSCLGCSDPNAILDILTGLCVIPSSNSPSNASNITNTSNIGAVNNSLSASNTTNTSNMGAVNSSLNSSNTTNTSGIGATVNSSLNASNTTNNSVINTQNNSSDSANVSNGSDNVIPVNSNSSNSSVNETNANTSINTSATNIVENASSTINTTTSNTEQNTKQNSTEKSSIDNQALENYTAEEEIDFRLG